MHLKMSSAEIICCMRMLMSLTNFMMQAFSLGPDLGPHTVCCRFVLKVQQTTQSRRQLVAIGSRRAINVYSSIVKQQEPILRGNGRKRLILRYMGQLSTFSYLSHMHKPLDWAIALHFCLSLQLHPNCVYSSSDRSD